MLMDYVIKFTFDLKLPSKLRLSLAAQKDLVCVPEGLEKKGIFFFIPF